MSKAYPKSVTVIRSTILCQVISNCEHFFASEWSQFSSFVEWAFFSELGVEKRTKDAAARPIVKLCLDARVEIAGDLPRMIYS